MSLFTWILIYREQQYDNRTLQDAQQLVDLLNYVISPEGQKVAVQINYAPLPEQALEKNRKLIGKITYGGVPVAPYMPSEDAGGSVGKVLNE